MFKFPYERAVPSRQEVRVPSTAETHSRSLEDTIPYGIKMVQAPSIWPSTRPTSPIKICIIDTGYDLGHEDLPNNDRITSSPTDFENALTDGDGHGTHIAGIMGAIGNGEGIVGSEWHCFYPYTSCFI